MGLHINPKDNNSKANILNDYFASDFTNEFLPDGQIPIMNKRT